MTIVLGLMLLQLQAAPQPAPQSTPEPAGIKITIYPLLVRAPIFGATIDLPDTGGGGEGGEQKGKTDWSLNAAYMAGISLQGQRWFLEGNGLWAAVSGDRATPFASLDSHTYFFTARGGMHLFRRVSATLGVRRVSEKVDLKLATRVTPNSTVSGDTKIGVWDPLFGLDWRAPANGRWTFDTAFQAGGFGAGADIDLQADFYADRHFGDHFDLRLGYTWVYIKLTVDNVRIGSMDRTFVSRQTLHGPAIGFGIVF